MKADKISTRVVGDQVIRFNRSERAEHIVLMITFTMLVLTGLPQKFSSASWASWMVLTFGGIDNVRLVHRICATLFTLQAIYHLSYVVMGLWRRRLQPSMVPQLKDFADAWQMLRYCLGLSHQHPAFSRFSYREKFEYWGVVLGAAIMIVTGLILWFPTLPTQILPGQIIPAAKEAHGGEALLAFLVIVIWHLYGVHLSPVHFPGDITIFTGKTSIKKMIEEHPLEYIQLVGPIQGEIAQTEVVLNETALALQPNQDDHLVRDKAMPET